jgi:predicted Zn-dependent protease
VQVVVYTGLLDLLASEDELAAVVAHEAGHVLARHHAERITSMTAYNLLQLLGSVALGITLPDAAFMLGVFLPYSRRAEHEADVLGLRLMARACYDPDGCTRMLQVGPARAGAAAWFWWWWGGGLLG